MNRDSIQIGFNHLGLKTLFYRLLIVFCIVILPVILAAITQNVLVSYCVSGILLIVGIYIIYTAKVKNEVKSDWQYDFLDFRRKRQISLHMNLNVKEILFRKHIHLQNKTRFKKIELKKNNQDEIYKNLISKLDELQKSNEIKKDDVERRLNEFKILMDLYNQQRIHSKHEINNLMELIFKVLIKIGGNLPQESIGRKDTKQDSLE